MPPALSWSVTADPARFEEAVAWFRARLPMSDADFYALDVQARRRAFGAAGIAQARLAAGLHTVLGKAIANGTTLEDFKDSFEHNLEAAWGGPRPWQVENIFRTNLQLAYGAGRYKQLTTPAMLQARPMWKLSVVLDSRTSPICQPIAGTILAADDPWWNTHIPPLHFVCRTAIIAMSRPQAEEDPAGVGLAEDANKAEPPLPGFGRPPELGEWAPDPTPLPPPIKRIYESKPPPPPPPPPPAPTKPLVPIEHTADHWLPTYARFDSAAMPMAHARAALERGLDTQGADVRTALEGIETPAPIRRLLHQLPEHGTLREELGRLTPGSDMHRYAVPAFRAIAALYGHQQALGANRITEAEIERDQWREHNKPIDSTDSGARRRTILGDFKKQMAGFLSSKVLRYSRLDLFWENRRAYFDDVHRKVVVAPSYDVRDDFVLAHEFAHSLEAADAKRGKAAVDFLVSRTQGEVPRRLADIIPGSSYTSAEVSTPDRFLDAYVGKRYVGGYPPKLYATEVTSMGIQWLFAKPSWFMERDEEHFLFTLGQLATW